MRKHFLRPLMAAAAIVCLVAAVAPNAWGQNPGPKVIPPDSVAYGRTYGEWSAAWNQWAFSIPVAQHPLFDNGDCSVGQSGPVWFLGGKFCANTATNCGYTNVVRSCHIPYGKAIFFPIADSEDSTLEEGNPAKPIADMRQFTASQIDGAADMSAEIDGAAIPHLQERFRVQSSAFGFTIPSDNLFSAIYPSPPGPFAAGAYYPAVDDGIYLMLSPLPPGPHLLHFHASFPVYSFSLDITYQLFVGK